MTLSNQTLPSPQHSEAANQFLRCVGRIRVAEKSGDDPAPYVAQARQWLAVVRLANPKEAATLEQELNRPTGSGRSMEIEQPIAWDWHLFLLRLAWIGVPFTILFMVAGPSIVVQVFAGIALVWLLLFIFLK
jgi:hypothetical protein